ncbi:MAG: MFS transporter, partial [Candidatus Sericytochromatia bacterium]
MRPPHDPYAVLRQPNFRRFLLGSTCALFGQAMVATGIGWDIYERTGSALALGWVGLVLFVPVVLLALPAGQLADRYDRRKIVVFALSLMVVSSLGLAASTFFAMPLWAIYAFLLVAGTAQAFLSPAKSALLPATVESEHLSGAVTWATGVHQFAFLAGPAAAGLLIGATGSVLGVYLLDGVGALIF